MKDKKEFTVDMLKVEGILSKGFGLLTKFLMCDIDLSLESRVIYSYLASFSGGGNIAFPSRDKITRDLIIGKDRYYKHYKPLIEEGYIRVERDRYFNKEKGTWHLGKNNYILVSSPKKFIEQKEKMDKHKNKAYQRVRHGGMKALGFGTIPKSIMIDPRLDIKAKGIYAYFSVFAGSGNSAFPKLKDILYHLQISEKTYYQYYKQLIETNYITTEQRHINGKLGVNDYYLNDNPDQSLVKKVTRIEIKPFLQVSRNKDIQNKDIQNEDIQNEDIQNKDIININSLDINSIKYEQSINQQKQKNKINRDNVEQIERLRLDKLEEIVREELKEVKTLPYKYTQSNRIMEVAIKELTEYNKHIEWYEANKYNKGIDLVYTAVFKIFNEALTELLTTDKMVIKGSHITYAKVYDKVVEGIDVYNDFIHIGSVMENSISDYTNVSKEEPIYSPISYMKAVIWNSLISSDVKITTEINRMWGSPSDTNNNW